MDIITLFAPAAQVPSATLNQLQLTAAPAAGLKGNHTGFNLRSPGDGHLYISGGGLTEYNAGAGAIYLPETDFGVASVTGSQWYYVYAHAPAGALSFALSTTPPDAAQRFGATLTSWVYLGCLRSQSGVILPFRMARGRYTYRISARALADWTALSAGTATTWTSVNLAQWLPPHARLARVRMALTNTTATGSPAAELRTNGDTVIPSVSVLNSGVSGTVPLVIYNETEIETDASQLIQYQINSGSGTSANKLDLAVLGFTE